MRDKKGKNGDSSGDTKYDLAKRSLMASLHLHGPSQTSTVTEASESEELISAIRVNEALEGSKCEFKKYSDLVSHCIDDDDKGCISSSSNESSDAQLRDEFRIYHAAKDSSDSDTEGSGDNSTLYRHDGGYATDNQALLPGADDESIPPQAQGGSSPKVSSGDNFLDRRYVYSRPQSQAKPLPFVKQQTATKNLSSEAKLEDGRNLRSLLRSRTSFYSTLGDSNDDFIHNKRKPGQSQASSSVFFQQENAYAKASNAIRVWSEKFMQAYKDGPDQFQWNHFLAYLKSSVREQVKREYFSYAMIASNKFTDQTNSRNYDCLHLVFERLGKEHPLWQKYKNINYKDLLQESGYSCLEDLHKLSELQSKLVDIVKAWRDEINTALNKFLILMNKLRSLELSIEAEDKKLDEFCYSGKTKLHAIFSTPYFKLSSQDFSTLSSPKAYTENAYGDAFLGDALQKWTTRDYASLRTAIQDMIVGKEYSLLAQRHNYLLSRIAFRSCQLGDESQEIRALSSTSGVNNKKRTPRFKTAITSIKRTFNVIPTDDPDDEIKCCAIYSTSSGEAQDWFQRNENDLRKLTYQTIVEQKKTTEIDWYHVANLVTAETGKERSSTDCRLVWLNEVSSNPKVSHKPWSKADANKLMKLGNERTLSWREIATKFVNRTAYQCFFKYRNGVVNKETMRWSSNKDELVRTVLLLEGPKWGKAVEATLDMRAEQHQVQSRWKKAINPMIRRGAFTRVEDALLLLTMDLLRGFVEQEHNFRIFMAYLPWRCETVWRDRANCLFSDLIIPWTIDEDKKLLNLAESQVAKKDWQKICEQFASCKNRKNCFTRYSILMKKIGPGKQFATVEEYHEAYSMTRYNVFQHKHLKGIVEILKCMLETTPPSYPFTGLRADKPPSELELRWILLDFDRETMSRTIKNLEKYMLSRTSQWKEWIDENGAHKKTFDRRSFHRDDPKSIASVIHIRGLRMVPETEVKGPPLNSFESAVYFHYARFRRTKALKKDTERPHLPKAKKLCKLPEIRRIVRFSSDNGDSSSGSDWPETTTSISRKRGRPKKISRSDDVGNKPRKQKLAKAQKTGRKGRPKQNKFETDSSSSSVHSEHSPPSKKKPSLTKAVNEDGNQRKGGENTSRSTTASTDNLKENTSDYKRRLRCSRAVNYEDSSEDEFSTS